MSLTREDWNRILVRQQNEVKFWDRIFNDSDKLPNKAMLQVELELLEKICEEMNKCKK